MHIWLRNETKQGERRTPLTPPGARILIENGFRITVESSKNRIFPDHDYKQNGCELVPPEGWKHAPKDAWILGLKELPPDDFSLIHRHIYFAHAYKNQSGWQGLLKRFKNGDGMLYDLEYLTDEAGRRVAAFGYWAGFAGTAVALLVWQHQKTNPKIPFPKLIPFANVERLIKTISLEEKPEIMILGALGRCGQGAQDMAKNFGLKTILWDQNETRSGGSFEEILRHEIFLNCVLVQTKTPPFLTNDMLSKPRKLSVICDVSCDPFSPLNPLPIYKDITTFEQPTQRLCLVDENPVDLIAIDHLPSLLPKESSEDFCEQLLPHLLQLGNSLVWQKTEDIFNKKFRTL